MTTTQILGAILLSAPFLFVALLMGHAIGWIQTAMMIITVIAIMACITFGAILISL